MKYGVLIKSTDELESTDFSEEITNKYKNIKIQGIKCDDTIISYIRESDGKEVVTTIKQLLEEWREQQFELIFDSLAERVAKKMHEVSNIVPKREIPPNMKQVLIPKHCIVPPSDAVPSTKAVPAAMSKRGKWIQANDVEVEYAVCTNCKQHGEFYMRYCPNCGARMESGE